MKLDFLSPSLFLFKEHKSSASLVWPSFTWSGFVPFQNLHQQGARAFWIHNTGPIGCLPFFVVNYPPKAGNADQHGCVKSYNDLAQEFNKQLKDKIFQLRMQLQDVFISYVDIYSAKYALIGEAKKHGKNEHMIIIKSYWSKQIF